MLYIVTQTMVQLLVMDTIYAYVVDKSTITIPILNIFMEQMINKQQIETLQNFIIFP